MAFVGEIDLHPVPWRNTDVQIHALHDVGVERQEGEAPFPEGAPVATIAIAATGSLTFESILSYVVIGEEDWALRYTAVEGGEAGDDITVTYVDPAANDEPLAVAVTGTDIEVTLATGPAGAITSTADDIAAAIVAEEDSDALVVVSNEGLSDGTGVAEAVAETALAAGLDALAPGAYVATGEDPDGDQRYVAFDVAAA